MIEVYISKDKLEARITIRGQKEAFPSSAEIYKALQENGVRFGIDRAVLEQMAAARKAVYKEIIARGRPPQFGKQAVIEWRIPTHFTLQTTTDNARRIDFKKAAPFERVVENQVLATKTEPEPGTDGKAVTAETLSSLGNNIRFPAGRNTHISEDGSRLLANISGNAFFENGLVHVDRIYHIRGNVSYATGNVKFDGPVVIEGDVRSGFRVEARDSVYISGNVEAANIYSQRGDITVAQGIVGQKRAKILAGGSLHCGFVQDATVGVRRDIIIDRYAMNSSLTAGGQIKLTQNEGLVRGGILASEKGIVAKNVGSERNYYTELKLQNHGENESQHQLWEISKARSELTVRLSSLNKRLSFLNILESRLEGLSQDKKAEQNFLKKEINRLNKKITELDEKELLLQKEASKERMNREIQVLENLYPNVSIDLSGLGFHTDQTLQAVKIFRFKDEIIVESLLDLYNDAYDIFVPTKK